MTPDHLPAHLGRYTLHAVLGKGTMGVVYRATDTATGREVAIKTLQLGATFADGHEMLERFKREGMTGIQLAHPNVVKIHEYGEAEGMAYLVMDRVAGESLKTLNARKKHWPLFEALDLADQLLEALDYFHTRGIVHRDIKPGNIMVDDRNHLTVTDFGIARIPNSSITQVGTVLGTPWYMSPEQMTDQALDGRSDLFSVGVILYELLTGVHPFKAHRLTDIIDQIVSKPHLAPSVQVKSLPAALDTLFARALAKNPAERFQTGAEFRAALRRMVNEILPGRGDFSGWRTQPQRPQHHYCPACRLMLPSPLSSGTPCPRCNAELPEIGATQSAGDSPRVPERHSGFFTALIVLVLVGGIGLFWSSQHLPTDHSAVLDRTPVVSAAGPPVDPEEKNRAPGPPADTARPSCLLSPVEAEVLAEFARQCAIPHSGNILVPHINGLVRCERRVICHDDARALIEIHRKLAGWFADSQPSLAALPADAEKYLDVTGCTSPRATRSKP